MQFRRFRAQNAHGRKKYAAIQPAFLVICTGFSYFRASRVFYLYPPFTSGPKLIAPFRLNADAIFGNSALPGQAVFPNSCNIWRNKWTYYTNLVVLRRFTYAVCPPYDLFFLEMFKPPFSHFRCVFLGFQGWPTFAGNAVWARFTRGGPGNLSALRAKLAAACDFV